VPSLLPFHLSLYRLIAQSGVVRAAWKGAHGTRGRKRERKGEERRATRQDARSFHHNLLRHLRLQRNYSPHTNISHNTTPTPSTAAQEQEQEQEQEQQQAAPHQGSSTEIFRSSQGSCRRQYCFSRLISTQERVRATVSALRPEKKRKAEEIVHW